jgi:hypothetical protein
MALFQLHQEHPGHARKLPTSLRSGSLSESSEASCDSSLFESSPNSPASPIPTHIHKLLLYSKFGLPRMLIDWLDVWRIWYGGEFGFAVMDWTEALILRE